MERVFEILKDGQWVPVEFKDMKKGDRFRAFDRDDRNIGTSSHCPDTILDREFLSRIHRINLRNVHR